MSAEFVYEPSGDESCGVARSLFFENAPEFVVDECCKAQGLAVGWCNSPVEFFAQSVEVVGVVHFEHAQAVGCFADTEVDTVVEALASSVD